MLQKINFEGRLKHLAENVVTTLKGQYSELPSLASSYYFRHSQRKGKLLRPRLVLLISQATNERFRTEGLPQLDIDVSTDTLSNSVQRLLSFQELSGSKFYKDNCLILPTQQRLAEITEMIHTASLLHDDVIDNSPMRRHMPTVNEKYGNKVAILGGDYLLAKASVSLARIRNVQVVEILASVIANLVEGELMQLEEISSPKSIGMMDRYLKKSYMKTASLMAESCKAAALLGNCEEKIIKNCYEFGKNFGLAFQVLMFIK